MVASTVTRQRVEGRPMTEELRLAGVPVRDEVTGRRGLAAQSASHHSSEMRGTQHLAAQALGLPMDHRVPINAVPTEGHDSRPGFRRSLRRGQVRRKPAAFAAGSRSGGGWDAPFPSCPYPGYSRENCLVRGRISRASARRRTRRWTPLSAPLRRAAEHSIPRRSGRRRSPPGLPSARAARCPALRRSSRETSRSFLIGSKRDLDAVPSALDPQEH